MKTLRCCLPAFALGLALFTAPSARAATRVWTNLNGGSYTLGANWLGGVAPGLTDSALFVSTNASFNLLLSGVGVSVTNSDAFFNTRGGVITQQINLIGGRWLLTNSYIVGQSNNTTATVHHVQGALFVTNAARTARMVIGQNGRGTYNLAGGSVEVDGLFVTNNGAGVTNSTFNFLSGTLTTHTNSRLVSHGDFRVGFGTNAAASWFIRGGTVVVTNITGNLVIGANTTTGLVQVAGAGTLLSNNTAIKVNSSNTRLIVSNGATVAGLNLDVGTALGGTNATLTVTGAGSLLSLAGDLNAGLNGIRNHVVITNGGVARVVGSTILADNPVADGNTLTVAGSGSLLSNLASLIVGFRGYSNQLIVRDGGTADANQFFLGSSALGSNNSVLVTGAGSLVRAVSFSIGAQSRSNLFVVTNGGAVVSEGSTTVGAGTSASNNTLIISGAGTRYNSLAGTFALGSSSGDQLLLINAGGALSNVNAIIGSSTESDHNRALVTGAGSAWTNSGTLTVGSGGSGNTLAVSNAARLRSVTSVVGSLLEARSNRVLITGSGSFWTNSGPLTVGVNGSSNLVEIAGAAQANVVGTLTIGATTNAVGNRVIVGAGAGGTLNAGTILVGSNGPSSSLVVTSGIVNASGILIGAEATATNSRLDVVGGQIFATTSTSDTLEVRHGTLRLEGGNITMPRVVMTNNSAAATNAAIQFNTGNLSTTTEATFVAHGVFSIGNSPGIASWQAESATVAITNLGAGFTVFGGASNAPAEVQFTQGTTFTNTGSLVLGSNAGNSLLVFSNGAVGGIGSNLTVGFNASAASGTLALDGTGTALHVERDLTLGRASLSNRLFLTGGALLANSNGSVGGPLGGNAYALVSDAGTVWNNAGLLSVGVGAAGSELLVTNGGRVSARSGFVGNGTFGSTATVAGPGSVWSNLHDLTVGFAATGDDNLVRVLEGGTLVNSNGVLGSGAGSDNNAVLVAGPGSLWSNKNQILLRNQFSQVVVSNGGALAGQVLDIGGGSGDVGNRVVLTGPGSEARLSTARVGVSGSFGELRVEDGARLDTSSGLLGVTAGANSNNVLVTGAGSLWTNTINLTIGSLGSANTLTIASNGTLAVDGNLVISDQPGASNNTLVVAGGSIIMTNSGLSDLIVGRNDSGTLTFNGGTIATRRLISTNNAGPVNSVFNFNHGTLITLGDSAIRTPGSLILGNVAGQTAEWRALGGTTVLSPGGGGGNTFIGGGLSTDARLLISGPTTVFSNLGTLHLGPFVGNDSRLTVTNGARLHTDALEIGGSGFGRADIAGPNTRLDAPGASGIALLGGSSVFNLLGGARATSTQFYAEGALNTARVDGAGTRLSLTGNVDLRGGGSQFILSGGATGSGSVFNLGAFVGSSNHLALFTGPGTVWSTASSWVVGGPASPGNRLVVSNGAVVSGVDLFVAGPQSLVRVEGAGSLLTTSNQPVVSGSQSQVIVSDGGRMAVLGLFVGSTSVASNNLVLVTGAGSVLSNRAVDFTLGFNGSGNRLVVSNGGTVAADILEISANAIASNNAATVAGGHLVGTAGAGAMSRLTIGVGGSGRLDFNGGTIATDRLVSTNNGPGYTNSIFNFNHGVLTVRTSSVNRPGGFLVGDGTNAALLHLLGNGTHTYPSGLTIRSNSTLAGTGTILGGVTNFGALSPGASAGALTINGDLRLQPSANLVFEIGGLIPTNQYDQVSVAGFTTYAGTLSLSLLNDFLPDDDDSFTLFKVGSFSGAFANAANGARVNLTNNLASFLVTYSATNLVLGDIEYVDTDGDGQGDLQEQAAGTDPNDSTDALQIISITENASGHKLIQFLSQPGKSYRIEHTTNLSSGFTGIILSPILTTPAVGVSQWIDDGSITGGLGVERYYRIGLQ